MNDEYYVLRRQWKLWCIVKKNRNDSSYEVVVSSNEDLTSLFEMSWIPPKGLIEILLG